MIVPEQEAFGHLHHVLQYEKYADLAETPHGNVLAPGQPGSLPLINSWFTQIAADFPSPFLHIGADETFDLGTGRSQARRRQARPRPRLRRLPLLHPHHPRARSIAASSSGATSATPTPPPSPASPRT